MCEGTCVDDPSIDNNCVLFRRVPPGCVLFDKKLNVLRPTSEAFQNDNKKPMSIALEDTLINLDRDPLSILEGHPGFGLVKFTAGFVRTLVPTQSVARERTDEEPAHGVVCGKKTGSIKKKFYKNCIWVKEPDTNLKLS